MQAPESCEQLRGFAAAWTRYKEEVAGWTSRNLIEKAYQDVSHPPGRRTSVSRRGPRPNPLEMALWRKCRRNGPIVICVIRIRPSTRLKAEATEMLTPIPDENVRVLKQSYRCRRRFTSCQPDRKNSQYPRRKSNTAPAGTGASPSLRAPLQRPRPLMTWSALPGGGEERVILGKLQLHAWGLLDALKARVPFSNPLRRSGSTGTDVPPRIIHCAAGRAPVEHLGVEPGALWTGINLALCCL